MTYYHRNTGDPWSAQDDKYLHELIAGNTPTGVIAFKLGRTEEAIYHRAGQLGYSVKPTNQSPYNRQK